MNMPMSPKLLSMHHLYALMNHAQEGLSGIGGSLRWLPVLALTALCAGSASAVTGEAQQRPSRSCIVEYVEDFSGGDEWCGCGYDPMFHHSGQLFGLGCHFDNNCVLNLASFRSIDIVTWTLPVAGYEVINASAELADNCGAGCTTVTFHGENGSVTFSNPAPTGGEFLHYSTEGLGLGVIELVELQSLEGFFDNIRIIAAPIDTLLGDINGDRKVDGTDLGLLLGGWGACADCSTCEADFNCDCTVNGADLGTLIGAWTG